MTQRWLISIVCSAVILWTFGIFVTKLAEYFFVYEQVLLRSGVALLGIILIVLITRVKVFPDFFKQQPWRSAAFLLWFPLSIILFTWAVTITNATTAIFLLYAGSLLSTLIIWALLFDETLSKVDIFALVCCIVWIACFGKVWEGMEMFLFLLPGLWAGIAEGLVHAARHRIAYQWSSWTMLLWQHIATVLLCGLVMVLLWQFHTIEYIMTVPWSVWLYGLWFGVLLLGVSWLLLYGYRYYPVHKATIILSSELWFALLFNLLILSLVPDRFEILGAVLLIGIAVVVPLIVKSDIKFDYNNHFVM